MNQGNLKLNKMFIYSISLSLQLLLLSFKLLLEILNTLLKLANLEIPALHVLQ